MIQGLKHLVIIGAGNVGTHLARLFCSRSVAVSLIYKDELKIIQDLKHSVDLLPMGEIPVDAELYLLALKDSVISEVASSLPDMKGVVAHTSGSESLEPLLKFQRRGIFYPFQSFRKEIELTVKDFPVLLEASDASSEAEMRYFAHLISSDVISSTEAERARIHASGVFVSNFTNLMYGAGWQVAGENSNAEKLLLPLIEETAVRLKYKNPSDLQTGPAIRNDRETISKHLKILEGNADLYKLYRELTNALLKKYGHEELP